MIRRLSTALLLALALAVPAPDLRCMGAPRRWGKGGGSSSSASTSNETTTVQVDKRQAVDSGVGVSADDSNVNLSLEYTDRGAVSDAFSFARDVGEGGAAVTQRVLDIADRVFADAFRTIGKTTEAVQTAGNSVATAYDTAKGAGSEKTLVTIAALAVVAVVAVQKWGK